jgi:hypothetical protein
VTTKRPKRCNKDDCKAPAAKGRRGKCTSCYRKDWKAGEKTLVDDLGPDPASFHFKGPRVLEERFHAAVPESGRSRALRDALTAHLDGLEEPATDDAA